MPTRPSQPVPPRLVISEPGDKEANTLATRRRSAGPSPTYKELERVDDEWKDVDDVPRRRRRRSRRTASGNERLQISAERQAQSDFGRFFPKLSRILETPESNISSRPGTRGSDRSRQTDRTSRRTRHRDDTSSIYTRSPRQKTGGVQRRTSSGFKINPSLLSVLSGLTSTSDRSSGSNSTITQRSYNKRGSGEIFRTPSARPRRTIMEVESTVSSVPPSRSPNVFDYMQSTSGVENDDRRSTISSCSSVSSHYQPSDAGSSEAPGTPSSRSTIPSPTATRTGSVAELRRKYDQQYAASTSSRGSSPRSSLRNLRKQPSVSDVLEDEEEEEEEGEEESIVSHAVAPSELNYDPSAHKHTSFQQSGDDGTNHRHRQHAEQMHQSSSYNEPHYQPHPQHPDQHYLNQRSSSMSSDHAAAYPHHMALEHYQYPIPPAAPSPPAAAPSSPYPAPSTSPYAQHSHLTRPPPAAPEAPDLRKRTIAGYELLALELASSSSRAVKPLYRKFDYLHHRILLHLQDELAEMESQLRTLDEIIAQLSSPPNHHPSDPTLSTKQPPASRRAETYSGSGIHAQRTALLGRIFLKTEQYHAALRNRNEALRDAVPATKGDVEAYKSFLAKERPLVNGEAEFVLHGEDLIHPSSSVPWTRVDEGNVVKTAALYAPLLLALPLLLFTLIPTFVGRVVVTALLGAGGAMVVASTKVGGLLGRGEWLVCGGVYGVVMCGIAGCVPAGG